MNQALSVSPQTQKAEIDLRELADFVGLVSDYSVLNSTIICTIVCWVVDSSLLRRLFREEI